MQAQGRLIGLVAGLVFGMAWIFGSFAEAVLVLVVGVVGYYVGAILTGDLDLVELLARRGSR